MKTKIPQRFTKAINRFNFITKYGQLLKAYAHSLVKLQRAGHLINQLKKELKHYEEYCDISRRQDD